MLRIYLAEWLRHLGLTQQDLANMMGTNKGTISRYATEARSMRPAKVRQIADALGIDPKLLFQPPMDAEKAALMDRFSRFLDAEGVERGASFLDLVAPQK